MELDQANMENSIEHVLKPIVVLGRNLTILRVNKSLRDMLGGFDPSGAKCHQLLKNSEGPCDSCPILRSIETGVTDSSSGCLVEQGPLKLMLRVAALLGPGEQKEMAVLVAEPVTEQTALIPEEGKFRSIVEHSPLWVIETDTMGGVTYLNLQAEKQSGFTLDMVRGRNVLEFVPEEHRAEQMQMLMRGLQGLHNPVRTPIKMKDGVVRTFLNNSAVISGPEGQRMVVFAIDVTPWVEAEQALIKQMTMEKTASVMSKQLAGGQDPAEAFNTALKTLCEATGCSRAYIYLADEKLMRISKAHEYCCDDAPTVIPMGWTLDIKDFPQWRDMLLSGEPVRVRDTSDLPPGSTAREVLEKDRVGAALMVPMKHHEEHIGVIGLDFNGGPRDWTESEVRLLSLVAEIVTAFIIRTRSEENDRIAREAAQTADRAKTVFLANMSHEIRTPLTGITGMIELAMETDLTPEQKEYLSLARSSASTLLGLLGGILDLAKIEAGKLDLECAPFDLRSAVEDTVSNLSLRAQEAGLEVMVRVDPAIPRPLLGDENRLRQILSNLVDNAIKYCPKGDVSVAAELAGTGPGTFKVKFRVADTGVGIPREMQAAIFDAFTQGEAAVSGGAGLGLAISRQLVHAMGGVISLESQPGHGSAFSFVVSFQATTETIAEVPEFVLENRKALIVDPSEGSRGNLATLLEFYGMAAVGVENMECASVAAAEAQIREEPFDLVFLDTRHTAEPGAAVTRLRDAGVEPGSIVVLHPGTKTREEDTRQWELRGVGLRLLKPARKSSVEKLLARFFQEPTPPKPTRIMAKPGKRGPLKILLAEDNLVNRKLITSLLQKRGFVSVQAIDGDEAVSRFRSQPFDAILMDIQMPGVDGLEATRAIRKEEALEGGHTPIIAMTAHAMMGDREKCIDAGMDDYLSKPVRFEELVRVLLRWTSGSGEVHEDREEDEELRSGAPLNFEDIRSRLGMDPVEILELVDLLLKDAPQHLESMKKATDEGRVQDLGSAAHRVKGAAGNLGAQEVFRCARELELAARSGAAFDALAMISRIEKELSRLRDYVTMMRKTMR